MGSRPLPCCQSTDDVWMVIPQDAAIAVVTGEISRRLGGGVAGWDCQERGCAVGLAMGYPILDRLLGERWAALEDQEVVFALTGWICGQIDGHRLQIRPLDSGEADPDVVYLWQPGDNTWLFAAPPTLSGPEAEVYQLLRASEGLGMTTTDAVAAARSVVSQPAIPSGRPPASPEGMGSESRSPRRSRLSWRRSLWPAGG